MPEKSTSCVVGTQQSPIDIKSVATVYSPCLHDALNVQYTDCKVMGKIIGHDHERKFELDAEQNAMLVFKGMKYHLHQIHFHVACEHKIDGKQPSQHELHLLHVLPNTNDKLVLALFYKVAENAEPRDVFRLWGDGLRNVQDPPQSSFCLPLAGLFGSPLEKWFYYEGSLTSPPFSEDVTWLIDSTVESINASDIGKLATTKQKQRPEMMLNRRFVLRNFA